MTDPEDALRAALRDPALDAAPAPDDLLSGVLRRRDLLRRRRQRLATVAAAAAAVAVLGGVTAAVSSATGGQGAVAPAGRPDPVPAPTSTVVEPVPATPFPSAAPTTRPAAPPVTEVPTVSTTDPPPIALAPSRAPEPPLSATPASGSPRGSGSRDTRESAPGPVEATPAR
jgi:hypothetical protein